MECLLKTNAGHRQKASAKNWVCIMLTVLCGMQIRALCFEEAVCVPCFVLALGGSLPLALRLWCVVCGVMCGVWCVCVVCVWCVCVCVCVCVGGDQPSNDAKLMPTPGQNLQKKCLRDLKS